MLENELVPVTNHTDQIVTHLKDRQCPIIRFETASLSSRLGYLIWHKNKTYRVAACVSTPCRRNPHGKWEVYDITESQMSRISVVSPETSSKETKENA